MAINTFTYTAKRGAVVPLLFLLLLSSCIGTKPFGFRKVSFRTNRSYYSENHLKEITYIRRTYIKDCPGCPEKITSRKKQYLENGKLIYREKMKRRMYTAKLLYVKSSSYYDNGTIKEHYFYRRGEGVRTKYSPEGKITEKKIYPKQGTNTIPPSDEAPGDFEIGK